MEASEIIEVIKSAFQGVSRGVGISLHEARVVDDYGTPTERSAARELDSDTEWQHLRDDDLSIYSDILTYADPISWRYHLPAFMVFTLRYGIRNRFRKNRYSDSNSCYGTMLTLCNVDMKRFSVLDQEQAKAVYLFLDFLSNQDVNNSDLAAEAIEKYWKKFCPAGA